MLIRIIISASNVDKNYHLSRRPMLIRIIISASKNYYIGDQMLIRMIILVINHVDFARVVFVSIKVLSATL